MKTIKLDGIVVGNLKYNATLSVSESVENELLRQGALRVLQGQPSGTAEKNLLGTMFPGKKRNEIEIIDQESGKPRAFRRTDIPFGPELVSAFEKEYKAAEVTVGEDDKGKALMAPLGITEISFEEYTGTAAAVPKYKAEKDLIRGYLFEADGKTPRLLKSGEPRTAATFAENRGLEVPTEPWEEDTDFLTRVKAWVKEQNAKED